MFGLEWGLLWGLFAHNLETPRMSVGEEWKVLNPSGWAYGKILSTVWEVKCMVLTQIGQAGFYSDFGGVGAKWQQ